MIVHGIIFPAPGFRSYVPRISTSYNTNQSCYALMGPQTWIPSYADRLAVGQKLHKLETFN